MYLVGSDCDVRDKAPAPGARFPFEIGLLAHAHRPSRLCAENSLEETLVEGALEHVPCALQLTADGAVRDLEDKGLCALDA